jgi:hypothetical protein
MPQRGVPIVELRTPRLILRFFRDEDGDAIAQVFANPPCLCRFKTATRNSLIHPENILSRSGENWNEG